MFAFPGMLVPAAEKAGMKVPPDADNYEPNEFPHFAVFCILQLGRRMVMGEHWENAKIIAAMSEEEVKTACLEDFLAKGLSWST